MSHDTKWDSHQKLMMLYFDLVVAQWSACTPSTLVIWVQIMLKSNDSFSLKCFWKEKHEPREVGVGLYFKSPAYIQNSYLPSYWNLYQITHHTSLQFHLLQQFRSPTTTISAVSIVSIVTNKRYLPIFFESKKCRSLQEELSGQLPLN